MGVVQSRRYCTVCEGRTLHERPAFGFGWGCLLTVLTAGLFIPVWVIISLWQSLFEAGRCQDCGSKRGPGDLFHRAREGHAASLASLAFLAASGLGVAFLVAVVCMAVIPARGRQATAAREASPPPGLPAAPAPAAPRPPDPSPAAPPVVESADPEPESESGPFRVGDRVRVFRPGGAGNAHATRDAAAYDTLQRAIRAGDLGTFSRMREAGDVLIVANGTSARVVAVGPGRARVRIEDGPWESRRGWIAVAHLWPAPDEAPVEAEPTSSPGPAPTVSSAPPKSADPTTGPPAMLADVTRARQLLRSGRNLEKLNHPRFRRRVLPQGDQGRAVVRRRGRGPRSAGGAREQGPLTPIPPSPGCCRFATRVGPVPGKSLARPRVGGENGEFDPSPDPPSRGRARGRVEVSEVSGRSDVWVVWVIRSRALASVEVSGRSSPVRRRRGV